MPTYEFRCDDSHVHERILPMGSEERESACPECGHPARRLISAPGLCRAGSKEARLIDATRATTEKPAVVSSVPESGVRRPTPVSRDPRHAKLPRP